MYFIIIAVIIGGVIGSLTNHLAIKMLFHPYTSWKIGVFHVPFTPGLIPKRRDDIAFRLGRVVEDYLFTVEGMKGFIEKSNFKEKAFNKITNIIDDYKIKDRKLGDELSKLFTKDWQKRLGNIKDETLNNFLNNEELRKKTLEEVLSEGTLINIDEKIDDLSKYVIKIISEYIFSLEGKRKIRSIISQLMRKNGTVGFLTGLFIDVDQINEKTITYLNQILSEEKTRQTINKLILDVWVEAKKEPLGIWFDKFDVTIKAEVDNLFIKVLDGVANISTKDILERLEKNNYIEKTFYLVIELLIERLNQFFSYLSISEVVETEVKNFSMELLEETILGISGKELKMITYFGGLIGGLIGLFQGILYMLL